MFQGFAQVYPGGPPRGGPAGTWKPNRSEQLHRPEKEELVASLNRTFDGAELVVVTHQTGLSVAEITELRRRMREVDASYKVVKNRLARLALDGSKYADLAPLFVGPTAIAVSQDPVAAAKVAVKFAKENQKLEIAGGAMGERQLDVDGVKALAGLPSMDELRAGLIGMLQKPATRMAVVLREPAGQVARVLGAYAETGEAA
jgi:large subunit ribosomal protein L10